MNIIPVFITGLNRKNISKVLFSVKSTNSQGYSEKRHCLVPLALIIHILNDWYGNKNYEILGVAICVALLRALLVNLSSHGYGEGSYLKKNPSWNDYTPKPTQILLEIVSFAIYSLAYFGDQKNQKSIFEFFFK